MKKIFYILFVCFLFFNLSYASENETFKMPTDAEIERIIDMFNVETNQKEYIIQETKKQLKNLQENPSALNGLFNGLNNTNSLLENEN